MPDNQAANQDNTPKGDDNVHVDAEVNGSILGNADQKTGDVNKADSQKPPVENKTDGNNSDAGDIKKADEAKDDSKKSEGDEGKKSEGAPETYDIKPPEGYESFDQETFGKIEPLLRAKGMTNEEAQGLINTHAEHVKNAVQKALESRAIAEAKIVKEWKANIKADPDFGGAKYNETVQRAHQFIRDFGDVELGEFLKGPAGDNPALIKAFARAQRALGEGGFIEGNPANVDSKNKADRLYKNENN